MAKVKNPVVVAVVFYWIGMVGAISFMESWLKFQAPGITLALGSGIGRLVFNVLNKTEWILAMIIIANIIIAKDRSIPKEFILFIIALILLVIQTIWLLPSLDIRVEMLTKGQSLPDSNLHFYYVGTEVIKVFCLFIFGVKLFK